MLKYFLVHSRTNLFCGCFLIVALKQYQIEVIRKPTRKEINKRIIKI